jgi:hypothetical protein
MEGLNVPNIVFLMDSSNMGSKAHLDTNCPRSEYAAYHQHAEGTQHY